MNYNRINFASAQRGAALIMALTILMVLALLGVTALNSTAMEHKMASNTLISNLAFQAADSGLAQAFSGSVSLTQKLTTSYSYNSGASAVSVDTSFIGYSNPPRSDNSREIYGSSSFVGANFDQVSIGTANDGRSTLRQGIRQVSASDGASS